MTEPLPEPPVCNFLGAPSSGLGAAGLGSVHLALDIAAHWWLYSAKRRCVVSSLSGVSAGSNSSHVPHTFGHDENSRVRVV